MTELDLINKYTQKELTAEDVFAFTLTLCDNEIDRDFECFSKDGLEKLKTLFLGKTGLFDHSASANDQNARIFFTEVVAVDGMKTSYGEQYYKLSAKAYMVRTKENESLIREIEGGIKKEVSVGCSVKQTICSICGCDTHSGSCKHLKGHSYDGNICHIKLEEPTDAYEWSFVAIPAQRNAGVSKSLSMLMDSYRKKHFDGKGESLVISKSEFRKLIEELDDLKEKAEFGELYSSKLKSRIRSTLALLDSEIDFSAIDSFSSSLSPKELESFAENIEKTKGKPMPTIQLSHKKQNSSLDCFMN